MAEPTPIRAASISPSSCECAVCVDGDKINNNTQHTTDDDVPIVRLVKPTRKAKPLTPSEARLANWLLVRLRVADAARMIRQHGAQRIIDTLWESTLVERVESVYSTGETRRWTRLNPELHNPGGFLRWVLEGGAS